MIKYIITFLMLIGIVQHMAAQSLTSNPYSYFGLGSIEYTGFAENSALGNTGIAMPSSNSLNPANPASYIGIDSSAFHFNVGMCGKYSRFSSRETNQDDFSANLKYAAIGFKISKRWASSIGIVPFSSRAYFITSTHPTDGEISDYRVISTGSGNINKFYVSNSFRLIKGLSLGINASYLFGNITNNEQIIYPSIDNFSGVNNSTSNYFNNFFFDFGLQYQHKIGNKRLYFGLTYNPKQSLKVDYEKLVMNQSDTVFIETGVNKDFTLPASIGIGLGANFANRLNLLLDFKTMNWSKSNYHSGSAKLKDSWQINTGVEYTNNSLTGKKYWDYVDFRLGMRFEKSYLNVEGSDINDMAVSVGLGLPIKYNRAKINVSYEFGIFGTTTHGLIRENYNKITFGVSLNDRWFQKRKFY